MCSNKDSEMNDRIRELWDKAAESTAAYPSGQNNSWETQVNFLDKFAELIVRDNIRTLRSNGYDDAAKCLQDIHFGVDYPV